MAAPWRGCLGVVKVATTATGAKTAVAKVSDWQFEETAEQLDASSMGTCTKTYVAGAKATTGTITCWWDDADTNGQEVLIVGNTVWLQVFPAGTGTQSYKTGSGGAVISSVSRQGGGTDGIVGSTFGFAVNGQLTATG